ncbi:MAG: serine hydrolase domain-containing protein [Erysipelotrichaceae bacterium]|nr:serine hydrolase domain-containing protein [Erysipelotrichaceae bacterium]
MFNDYLKKIVEEKRVPGIAVAHIKGDRNFYYAAGYNGYKEYLDNIIPAGKDVLYDMASCTKVVVTTTLILKLLEEDYFKLDTAVKDIIPEFRYDNVTVLDLLIHCSGLPADDKNYKLAKSRREMWQFTLNQPLVYETGTKVEYSDFGFIILGKIIEKYKGNIEDYAAETIFEPLGMNDSVYNPMIKGLKDRCAASEVTEERGVIQGIVHDGKAYKLNGLSGNAGLFSTTEDLSRFVRMMLNDGYPVLRKSTVSLLKRSYTEGLNLSRTIGWFYNDPSTPVYGVCSNNSLWHTGFSGTSILIDFERKEGVIILTNRIHPSRDNDITDIRKEIHSRLMG